MKISKEQQSYYITLHYITLRNKRLKKNFGKFCVVIFLYAGVITKKPKKIFNFYQKIVM